MAISVEVRHGNSNRGHTDWEMLRGLEGACASAEQHGDDIRGSMGSDQVQMAISVEVGYSYGTRPPTDERLELFRIERSRQRSTQARSTVLDVNVVVEYDGEHGRGAPQTRHQEEQR